MTTSELLRQIEELKTENANLLFANRYSMNVEAETLADLKLMTAERDALRTIIVNSVSALGTAANVSQSSSIEFLQDVPGEICMTVSSLKMDAVRLDWLGASKESHGFCHTGCGDYRYYALQMDGYKTVREVIDAAMKATS
jgi:hypothetical protein